MAFLEVDYNHKGYSGQSNQRSILKIKCSSISDEIVLQLLADPCNLTFYPYYVNYKNPSRYNSKPTMEASDQDFTRDLKDQKFYAHAGYIFVTRTGFYGLKNHRHYFISREQLQRCILQQRSTKTTDDRYKIHTSPTGYKYVLPIKPSDESVKGLIRRNHAFLEPWIFRPAYYNDLFKAIVVAYRNYNSFEKNLDTDNYAPFISLSHAAELLNFPSFRGIMYYRRHSDEVYRFIPREQLQRCFKEIDLEEAQEEIIADIPQECYLALYHTKCGNPYAGSAITKNNSLDNALEFLHPDNRDRDFQMFLTEYSVRLSCKCFL